MVSKVILSDAATGASQDIFGERVIDPEISLTYADVYKLHAVYHAKDISTTPVTPTLKSSKYLPNFSL